MLTPVHSVNKPPDGKDRFRRITADEVDAVLDLCQYKLGVTPTTSRSICGVVVFMGFRISYEAQ